MTDLRAENLRLRTLLWVEQNRVRLGLEPKAGPDLARSMLALGVLGAGPGDGVIALAGGALDDVVDMIRPESPILFRGFPRGDDAPAPKPSPAGLSAAERLAVANGDKPASLHRDR